MFLNNMFCHPTIVCRTDLFREVGLYPTDYPRAEDYALFFEAVRRFRTGNIPQCLVRTVITAGGISMRHRRQQLRSRLRIILKHFDCSPWAFYGLARNLVLYCLPWSLILKLKTAIHRP